jgi:hypothetical protein
MKRPSVCGSTEILYCRLSGRRAKGTSNLRHADTLRICFLLQHWNVSLIKDLLGTMIMVDCNDVNLLEPLRRQGALL